MTGPETQRVVLDLDPGEPIAGHISGTSGEGEAFRGWLELVNKLERLRGVHPGPAETPTAGGMPS
ncbi:MAG TPA: hypothetical protein VHX88_15165 [Solirubrobacteraceae bacterium]|nr:hypothetical protein [Solirubrobacteraceae bacterium]